MSNEGWACAATDRTPRWRRRLRSARHAVKFWLLLQWLRTGYRPTVRLLHWMNLHYAKPVEMMDGSVMRWCHWCGLRDLRSPPRADLQILSKVRLP